MKKIAISSAKGGVGKTTISYLIANKLKDEGLNVGLFDADLYGPNLLNLFNIKAQNIVSSNDKKLIEPLLVNGIQVASVDLVLKKQETLFWRGPMMSKVLKGMFLNVNWKDVEVLIIDMPPGTGDPYLTIFNDLDINESLLVCSDELLSIEDTKKTVQLLNRFKKNIIGLIENMSENFKLGQSIVESKNLNIHFHGIEIIGVLPRLSKKEIKNVYNNTSDIYKYLPDLS